MTYLERRHSDDVTALATSMLDPVGEATISILGPVEVWRAGNGSPSADGEHWCCSRSLPCMPTGQCPLIRWSMRCWGPARSGAGNRLQMAVCRLRRALAPLEADGVALRSVVGGYMLSVSPACWTPDVFRARIHEGRQALAAGDAARAADEFGAALELWRGDPLAEVAFEDFAVAEARRLEELRLSATEARIEAELRLGRHFELVGELEALALEHPTRERLAAHLITALYRSGRQADALACYHRRGYTSRANSVSSLGRRSRGCKRRSCNRTPRLN